MYSRLLLALTLFAAFVGIGCTGSVAVPAEEKPASGDWPMYGGTPSRNMVNTVAKGIPTEWSVKKGALKNVKWVAEVSKVGGTGRILPPVVAGGKIYVATNNKLGHDPAVKGHKALLMCFNEADGKFLWQIAHELPEALVSAGGNDEGLLSAPVVEGDRLYYMTPGAELVCADTKGKVVWTLDMMKKLKVVPFATAFGSPMVVGDLVFTVTGNGKEYPGDKPVPQPKAPSFVAVNKKDGTVAWSDNSPGENILEGTWSSPAYAEVNGKGQVIFPGGDGWLYSFAADKEKKLLWKFDCNPKGSEFRPMDSRATRSYYLSPVVQGNRVYTAIGQQPDNGPGVGHLWCVDVTKTGDISVELEKGKANPNSGMVWHYGGPAPKGSDRDYLFGRSISACAVHDGLVYAAELDGFLHCLDAKTGKHYWEEDLKANIWASPLWVDGKVYMPDDTGNVTIFEHGKEKKVLPKVEMDDGIKAAPVVANGVLYLLTGKRLYAIGGK